MIEIGVNSFPEIFHIEGMTQEVLNMFIQYFMSSLCY